MSKRPQTRAQQLASAKRTRRTPADDEFDSENEEPRNESPETSRTASNPELGKTISTSGNNNPNFETSIERLTSLMATFVESTLNRPPQTFTFTPKGDAVPIFDPKDRNQQSELWVKKVEELREVYKWSRRLRSILL